MTLFQRIPQGGMSLSWREVIQFSWFSITVERSFSWSEDQEDSCLNTSDVVYRSYSGSWNMDYISSWLNEER